MKCQRMSVLMNKHSQSYFPLQYNPAIFYFPPGNYRL
jgi:hypothetical protein